jgi:hypothetical protein
LVKHTSSHRPIAHRFVSSQQGEFLSKYYPPFTPLRPKSRRRRQQAKLRREATDAARRAKKRAKQARRRRALLRAFGASNAVDDVRAMADVLRYRNPEDDDGLSDDDDAFDLDTDHDAAAADDDDDDDNDIDDDDEDDEVAYVDDEGEPVDESEYESLYFYKDDELRPPIDVYAIQFDLKNLIQVCLFSEHIHTEIAFKN